METCDSKLRRADGAGEDELATAILEELAADERWEAAFAQSQQALAQLGEEARREHRGAEKMRTRRVAE